MVEFEIESWSHGKLNIAVVKAVVDKNKGEKKKILKSSVYVYNDIL